jgi:anaerobic magnesium-protoporphyrin IX monomethyl ester cyclase
MKSKIETIVSKKTRILFVNPISGIEGFLPIGISSLIAVLQKNGFILDLFDTTYYKTTAYDDRKKNELVGEFVPVDMAKYGVVREDRDYVLDFNNKIIDFNPHLIAVTIPTAFNYTLAIKLIEGISAYEGLLVVGGKYVTVNPGKLIKNDKIDIVCVGEGETPLLELCNSVENNRSYANIRNLWVKDGRTVVKNEIGLLEDMETLPIPNWDLFDKRHFYKPFNGRAYRYGHVEFSRGCPQRCSYCINENLQKLYKGKGKYFRKKSVDNIIEEMEYLKHKYNLEIIKFWDEEFLIRSERELEELAHKYKKINLPFLIDARLDHVTEKKAQLLKTMGCVNVSCGIESGSDYVRKNVLNRKMDNKKMIRGVRILNKYDIRTSTLNMIGIPFETRKNVFETIELNRISGAKNSSVMILQPYESTKIREVAVEAGFMEDGYENYSYTDSYLDMPQLSRQEILGLAKTFSLYRKVPKIIYPLVRLCEKDGKWRNKFFVCLHKIFKNK